MKPVIRTTDPVRRCAVPICLKGKAEHDTAVLGLHGFGGYPGELALPAQRLYARGVDVFVPRLPGHGTSQDDFDKTDRYDWVAAAVDAYRDMSSMYTHVHLLGHSMGGAIACLVAARFPVERMVLMAPALKFINPSIKMVPLLQLLRHRISVPWEQDPTITFFDDRNPDDDAYLGQEYWSVLNLRKVYELLTLSKAAVASLAKITASVMVLTGDADQTVDPSVGELIERQVLGTVHTVHLPEAGHLIPYDRDELAREKAMEVTVNFLTS
ncbi:MAG: alpha/beta hydrolase [Spirochaetota bacterium]